MQPPPRHKARGALSNPAVRFDLERRQAVDDGWDLDEDEPPPLQTTVTMDPSRSILTHNTSPDVPFDRSINPYRGCEHGCIYCFARPSHAYLGLSPGLDFETQLLAKPDAPRLLEAELRKKSYKPQVIAIGTNTDPYQPIERRYQIMRGCLKVLSDFGHPVTIVTKGHLVTRDIDILGPMAARNLARVAVSVTTLNRNLCRSLEPRAAVPAKRLDAIRALSEAGVPVTVLIAPLIPAINDHEIEAILAAAKTAGASRAGGILLRLPHEVKDLFEDWLQAHFPLRAEHVKTLLRQCRDGALYDSEYGDRMRGTGPYAALLHKRLAVAAQKLGLNAARSELDLTQFRPPAKAGDQMMLF